VEPRALAAIQEQLWRLITEPEGIEAALAAKGDAEGTGLAALVRSDRGLSPVARVAVYANAYFARIHDCLREDFGALARALGPAAYHDLVKTYLMTYPPTRPSLRHAGAQLVTHLSMEPFVSIFLRRCPYAADLARLEWALTEAFYAPDSPVLSREDLAAVAPEDWGALRFEASASLQVLSCAWPVHEVRERFDTEDGASTWDPVPVLDAESTHLRVWRQGERVRYRAISALEREALRAVQAGEPFAAVCDRWVADLATADAASRAAALLAAWLTDGVLASCFPCNAGHRRS